jgi:hypothetical protein
MFCSVDIVDVEEDGLCACFMMLGRDRIGNENSQSSVGTMERLLRREENINS